MCGSLKASGLLLVGILFLAVVGCGGRRADPAARPRSTPGGVLEGIASWYGKPYHGRTTASGERYDMHALTAAHRTLPFGTVVEVTHLENGRSVVVRITDRGPFIDGRIIDLSYGAAQRLKMVDQGLARVRLVIRR